MKTILILHDDSDYYQILKAIITKYANKAYQYLHAYNQKEALYHLQKSQADLILLKRNLLNFNWREFYNSLKHNPDHSNLGVIVMLPYVPISDEMEQVLDQVTANGDEYIIDPITPEALRKLVQKFQ